MRANFIAGFEKSDMGWDLTPSSLQWLLQALWDRYHVPLFITESGLADGNGTEFRRTRYLSACLAAIAELVAKGVDVRGYLVWTLLDNFEWAEGFRPRFGIIHNCFDTQATSAPPDPHLAGS